MSRGGLIIYNCAVANPEKVAAIYGDAPVMDFKSWPGYNQPASLTGNNATPTAGDDSPPSSPIPLPLASGVWWWISQNYWEPWFDE
jgi:hypothetical protein